MFAASILLGGCATLKGAIKKPTMKFNAARFAAADFKALQMDLLFDLHNPNPIGMKLDGYAMKLVVDGVTLLDGEVDHALDLRGGKTAQLVLPVTLVWSELIERVTSGRGLPDDLPFAASGAASVDSPIGRLSLPFSVESTIPVVKPPLVVPSGVRLTRASLSQVELEIDLDVKNTGSRVIGVEGFAPSITLGGKPVVKGALGESLRVEGKKTAKRSFKVGLSPTAVGMSLFRAITGGGMVDIGINGAAKIDTGFGKIPMSFSKTSSLRITK
jgi:LEA14-like dessication related protein